MYRVIQNQSQALTGTTTTNPLVSGVTFQTEFVGVGMCTHILVSVKIIASAAAGLVANWFEVCLLDVYFNGGQSIKLIDGLTLAELAAISDQNGGAMLFADTATNTTGTYQVRFAVPIGAIDVNDKDTLVCVLRLGVAGTSMTTDAGSVATIGVLNSGGLAESGFLRYSRTTFPKSNSARLERTINDDEVVEIFVVDGVGDVNRITVSGNGFDSSSADRDSWLGATFQDSDLSSIKAGDSIWNSALKVYKSDVLHAHNRAVSVIVECNASVTATRPTSCVSVSHTLNQARISASQERLHAVTAQKVATLEYERPKIAKALRHQGKIAKGHEHAEFVAKIQAGKAAA